MPRWGIENLHRAGTRYFHEIESRLTGVSGPGVPADNEAGVIGWGTSWRMQGYLMMAERTGRPAYAERLAELIDDVLDARDDVRGVRDHRGRSRGVWSTAGKFTAATAVIPDTDGRPALEVTVCPPSAHLARFTVETYGEGRFGLTLPEVPRRKAWASGPLSLDPADELRADRALYTAYTQKDGVTARLLPGDAARRIRPGVYAARPALVPLAAQTGMIVHPLASLARLARERPDAVPASVHARIDGYVDAAVTAIAAHDEQWVTTDDGRGAYRWLPDEPVSFAGAELPTNEFLAMGRALVQLAVVTGEPAHAERAEAMARSLRDDLTITDGVASWPYWPSFGHVYRGWSPTGSPDTDVSLLRPAYAPVTVPEDVTHALIDLDFLCLYQATAQLPPVFTPAEMRAVAATFTRNALHRRGLHPRLRHDVGGTGRPGTDREQAHVAAWLPLRQWSPAIPRQVRRVQPELPPAPLMGVDTYCGALLARWG
ncbi:hypothetical protein ACGFMM_07450 [Streptomyces sp. NPDC048604]|uniref:hypothetical protein n=1 Tax=Streptomyces sp. NPDC048604 TaxID=3365578 RepID=UPI00371DA5D6